MGGVLLVGDVLVIEVVHGAANGKCAINKRPFEL